ncbi:MAG: penicillin-binding protein transpeptidase, partial [Clostridiales bacterium]|nr:penicillin-binding protein transpeptidase [Clostridiales bacterium]
RNKALVDTYEPGSTFKAITSAAGLEEGVIRPDSPVTDKTVTVAGHNINCWKPNAHGNQTFAQGVYNSCNPVFVRVAQSIGVTTFYKYVRAFGFMDRTNIGLPEGKTIFHTRPTEIDMSTASFGQRFQITPVHLVTAYSAIANGGKLLKPQIIKEITDSQGNIVKKNEPEAVRNVISKQTSDTLKGILEGVVSEGTGGNAYVEGYRLAGKTGTSETTQENRYIASFVAFAPADNPVVVVMIAMDNPQVYPHTGGMIAAPVAGKLTEDILTYLEVERRYTEKDKEMLLQEVFVPDLRNKTVEEAKKILKEYGLEYKIENKGNNSSTVVMEQTPKPNVTVPQKSTVLLYTYKPDKQVMVRVPDLLNKTVSEASKALSDVGLNLKVDGVGTAIEQKKRAGELLPKGEVVEAVFRHLNTE